MHRPKRDWVLDGGLGRRVWRRPAGSGEAGQCPRRSPSRQRRSPAEPPNAGEDAAGTTAPAKTEPAKKPRRPADAAKAPDRGPGSRGDSGDQPANAGRLGPGGGIMAELDELELAKGFLKKILDAKLDEKQLADLARQLGSAVFTRWPRARVGARGENTVRRGARGRQQTTAGARAHRGARRAITDPSEDVRSGRWRDCARRARRRSLRWWPCWPIRA